MARSKAAPGTSGALSIASGSVTTRYYGFSLRETAGVAAVVVLRETGVVGGGIIEEISFLANETVREFYGPQGVDIEGDIYYQLVSGTVAGVIRYG